MENSSPHKLFKDKILCNVGYCPLSNLQATGVPDQLAITQEMASLKIKIDDLQKTLQIQISEKGNEITSLITELPETLKKCITDNFTIQGIVPLNYNEMFKV